MNNDILNKFHVPQKKFGQNFLVNQTVISDIIKLIDPKYEDHIIEIGPGKGALTKPICEFVKEISVIEIDKNLVNYLQSCSFGKKLFFFQQDAKKFDFQYFFNTKKKI